MGLLKHLKVEMYVLGIVGSNCAEARKSEILLRVNHDPQIIICESKTDMIRKIQELNCLQFSTFQRLLESVVRSVRSKLKLESLMFKSAVILKKV
ncbi:hypothetical protein T03_16060 [Trichinella britovi]|uniref:Uncharacterized protein n=1 Tax=Trichinella britovi TaxID=45882 RepID=A0A0V1D4T8_TRIBR|nr:hypothetical protein T03_16060 [Trichinella britovi]